MKFKQFSQYRLGCACLVVNDDREFRGPYCMLLPGNLITSKKDFPLYFGDPEKYAEFMGSCLSKRENGKRIPFRDFRGLPNEAKVPPEIGFELCDLEKCPRLKRGKKTGQLYEAIEKVFGEQHLTSVT